MRPLFDSQCQRNGSIKHSYKKLGSNPKQQKQNKKVKKIVQIPYECLNCLFNHTITKLFIFRWKILGNTNLYF